MARAHSNLWTASNDNESQFPRLANGAFGANNLRMFSNWSSVSKKQQEHSASAYRRSKWEPAVQLNRMKTTSACVPIPPMHSKCIFYFIQFVIAFSACRPTDRLCTMHALHFIYGDGRLFLRAFYARKIILIDGREIPVVARLWH